jgi:hypothetical protein
MVTISTVFLASLLSSAAQQSLDRDALSGIQIATAQLVVELEFLQDDIVGELDTQKDQALYRQAETVLGKARDFQRALASDVKRKDLERLFDDLDVRIQEVVKAVRELKPAQRALQRAAARAASSHEQICYLLFAGDSSPERMQRLIGRQAALLADAAKDLEQAGRYLLADQVIFDANIKKLAQAADRFQKSASLKDKNESQEDFAIVNQAWAQVVMDLQKLPLAESAYLARNASRLDRIHDRLFRLLGLPGKRAGLILRT